MATSSQPKHHIGAVCANSTAPHRPADPAGTRLEQHSACLHQRRQGEPPLGARRCEPAPLLQPSPPPHLQGVRDMEESCPCGQGPPPSWPSPPVCPLHLQPWTAPTSTKYDNGASMNCRH